MKYILIAAGLLVTTACKHKAKPADTSAPATEQQPYMPVADFIQNDIQKVDSFAGGILQKEIINQHKDSTFIKLKDFHSLATAFLPAILMDSLKFHQHFTENSLMDQTTQLINFIYTNQQHGDTLQKVIVYVSPGPAADKVDLIYMEKEFKKEDTIVEQKMTWKMNHYFTIADIIQPQQGPSITKIRKVIWDPFDYAAE